MTEFQHAFCFVADSTSCKFLQKRKSPNCHTQMLPVMVRSVCATQYSVEHLRHFKHKTIAKSLLETTTSVRKSGISWRKSHSFYTRGIPLKDRRSIRIFRAHEKRNCILSRASAAWSTSNGGTSKRHTRVDTVMVHPGHGRFTKTDLPRKNSGFTVAIQKCLSLKLC